MPANRRAELRVPGRARKGRSSQVTTRFVAVLKASCTTPSEMFATVGRPVGTQQSADNALSLMLWSMQKGVSRTLFGAWR